MPSKRPKITEQGSSLQAAMDFTVVIAPYTQQLMSCRDLDERFPMIAVGGYYAAAGINMAVES